MTLYKLLIYRNSTPAYVDIVRFEAEDEEHARDVARLFCYEHQPRVDLYLAGDVNNRVLIESYSEATR